MRVRHSKLLALIGAGILAVTALAACGNSDATTAQPSTAESSVAESTVAASSEAAPAEATADLSGSISGTFVKNIRHSRNISNQLKIS